MAAFAKNLMRYIGGSGASAPAALETPAPPVEDTAALASVAERRKRRMALTPPPRGGTQLTGPSGLSGAAPVERRSLLGG